MPSYKLVISDPKTGLTVQREVKDPESKALVGKRIGQSVKGDGFGLAGYEFMITGGSDFCGFPMRKDTPGTARRRILAVSGIGLRKSGKGTKRRKSVCGNTISDKTVQINLKIVSHGKENIFADVEAKVHEKKAAKKPKKEEAKESGAEPKEHKAEKKEAKKEVKKEKSEKKE